MLDNHHWMMNALHVMQHASAKAPEQPDAIIAALPPVKRRRTSQPPKKQEEYMAVSPAEAAGGAPSLDHIHPQDTI